MKVKDVMTPNPITVSANSTVLEAEALMHQADVRHIPVTDRGELIGMLSDRDLRSFDYPAELMEASPEAALEHLEVRVAEVCSSDLITTEPETDLVDAIAVMIKEKVGALPVVEPESNSLEGILSYIDVLKVVHGILSPQ